MAADFEVLVEGGHQRLVDKMKDYADRSGGTGTTQIADASVTRAKLSADIASELASLDQAVSGLISDTDDWSTIAAMVATGGKSLLVGTQVTDKYTRADNAQQIDMPWDVMHYATGRLENDTTIPVMYIQSHFCLPFNTQVSNYQGFLHAIDGLPAGTYNVSFASDAGNDSTKGKTFQFTLASALPAGGVLAGFRSYSGRDIYVYQSQADTSPTTVTATEGSGGTSLGTITVAGVMVPASGTPETTMTVTVDGTGYECYGLNAVNRIAYGNNRWLHSPLRQWLNATGSDWYEPATVFDVPPSYVGYPGFLAGLPAGLVAAMRPVEQRTALNYVTDGGTYASPAYDVTYDKVFLPSWEQHYIAVSQYYGGTSGLEGEAWDYWRAAYGSSTPPAAGATVPAYVQYDMGATTAARTCWMRSCNRSNGYHVTYVYSSGNCNSSYACNGNRAAPACAIG